MKIPIGPKGRVTGGGPLIKKGKVLSPTQVRTAHDKFAGRALKQTRCKRSVYNVHANATENIARTGSTARAPAGAIL